jgi:hypothetical protein
MTKGLNVMAVTFTKINLGFMVVVKKVPSIGSYGEKTNFFRGTRGGKKEDKGR